MSPEQLKNLQQLSPLFENGLAGPKQVKQLSQLLAEINLLSGNQNQPFQPLLS